MSKCNDSKGFTLIELAIVLVIIGVILGAVLKAQDLIENARIKKFISKVKAWENAQWVFFDRNRRFAGDGNGDGLIAHNISTQQFESAVRTDFTNSNYIEPPWETNSTGPTNTITIGSNLF